MESRSGEQMYMPTGEIFRDFLHLEPSFNVYLLLLCLICVSLFHLPVYIIRHCFRSFVFLPLLSWLHPTCCQICLIFPPVISRKSSPLGVKFPEASTLILRWSSPFWLSPIYRVRLCCTEQWWWLRGMPGWRFVQVLSSFSWPQTNTHS